MKIAVLGSGNGGHAVAFEWAKAGHDVYLFDFEQFPKSIADINQAGGIYSEGELDGFCKLAYCGHDIEKVVPGADLVFVVGPAYSTEPFGKACKPYVEENQIYVICPGSCAGSLVFKKALGLNPEDDSVIIAETSTLPYAVRIVDKAKIAVYNRLKGSYFLATFPCKYNQRVYDVISKVYPEMELADNVLQTTLQNANPIIHPSVTLLNAGLIERTKGDFFFYEDGVTEGVGRLIEALDIERMEVGQKLGVNVLPDPVIGVRQGYMSEETYGKGYSEAPGFKGIKAQSQLDHRYLNEDAGYGLVFFADLADFVGVSVPVTESVIQLASVVMKRDYKGEKARTLELLGLGGYDLEGLKKIL